MQRRTRLAAAATATAVLVGATLLGMGVGALEGFRTRALDRFQPDGPWDGRVVVVGLDAPTYRAFSAPLPRPVLGDLVDAVAAGDPASIVLDIVLDTTAADDVGRDAAIRDAAAAEDGALAAAIAAAGNVVLASAGTAVPTTSDGAFTLIAADEPLEVFTDGARAVAPASVAAERADQAVRAVPLYLAPPDPGPERAGLALAAVAVADGVDPVIRLRSDGVQVGERAIVAPSTGVLGIDFSPALDGAGDDEGAVAALDVLEGRVGPERFHDAIVFIGATDPLSGDVVRTPASSRPLPGVYVHANAANTILTGRNRDPAPTSTTLLAVLILAAIVGLVGALAPLRLLPIAVVGGIVGHLVVVDLAWQKGYEVDLVYPWLAAVAMGVGMVAFRYVTEVRVRRRVVARFGEYVPPGAVDELLAGDRFEAASAGERVDVTVLFVDLRGFTATSADLDPREVRRMLEHFYERAAEIIFGHDGTVMQYVGDEVFAVFGAPLPMPDHAARAVAAATDLRGAVAAINDELGSDGLPAIAYGIGLNSGPVVAGHVGNRFRRQYAVVGDTVNVGARLCSAAAAGELVLSGAVCERAGIPEGAEALDGLDLKGVARELGARRIRG